VAGAQTLQPTFTERTIKGTARIQNNKTLLLASVATGVETKGNSGLPLLGLIPILGRLFTSPSKDNRQVDIVIAVTPRVIRAPNILPEDEIERDTGSLQVPTNNTLEAMIRQEDEEELLAQARRLPTNTEVQLPDRAAEKPQYVKTETGSTAAAEPQPAGTQATTASVPVSMPENLKPIENSVKTLQLNPTADTTKTLVNNNAEPAVVEVKTEASTTTAPSVQMRFGSELPEMKAGDKIKVPVLIDGSAPFRSGVIGLKFDDKRLAVRSVSFGDVFGTLADSAATPFINQNGKMYVSLTAKDDAAAKTAGTLAVIEIEALVNGRPEIVFDRDVLNFLTADGKNFLVRF